MMHKYQQTWLCFILIISICVTYSQEITNLPIKPPNGYDPNNMLLNRENLMENVKDSKSEDEIVQNCLSCASVLKTTRSDLISSHEMVKKMQEEITSLKHQFLGKCVEKGEIDYEAYYRRLILHLKNALGLEMDLLKGSTNIVRLEVTVSSDHLAAFGEPLSQDYLELLDEFFRLSWKKIDYNSTSSLWYQYILSWNQHFHDLQLWIYGFGFTFIFVVLWTLFWSIKKAGSFENRSHILFVFILLLFSISYLWQWRIMIKKAEAKRMLVTSSDIAKNCINWSDSQATTFEWIKSFLPDRLTGRNVCEKYYEHVHLDAAEEITPLIVLAETCTNFALHPLSALGANLGIFFEKFFSHVSFVYLVPASIVLIILFLVVSLAFMGYSINFPFWLGGIRPNADKGNQSNKLSNEQVEKIQNEMQAFLCEAKYMLNNISHAAISHSQQAHSQSHVKPIVLASKDMIEDQLKLLVKDKFSEFVNSQDASNPGSRDCSRERSRISRSRTVKPKDKVDGKHEEDPFMMQVVSILDDASDM